MYKSQILDKNYIKKDFYVLNKYIAEESIWLWQEDVGIMKEMGMDAYRFSISWSRILPSKI